MSSWLPSHAKITVKEGKELRLKGRGVQGELYVSLNVDKETLKTNPVPRSTAPCWNHAFDITLMSLDTTVHITVVQSGKFRESFIGYLSIFLGGFKLTDKPVTNWYKLGSKPGKPNIKLRGDLLVTVTFYSDWAPLQDEGSWAESRFRRTISLRHFRPRGAADMDKGVVGKEGKERGSIFGRKKKQASGDSAVGTNEFASFKSVTPATTPSSQVSTTPSSTGGVSDTWSSYTLPVRGSKGSGNQSSGPSTGSDSPSSEGRSVEGGVAEWGGGGGGEGEADVGFRRGSGGSLRRRGRPRSIPDNYGLLPGTEPAVTSSNAKNNGGGGGDSRDMPLVGVATGQTTESEKGGPRGSNQLGTKWRENYPEHREDRLHPLRQGHTPPSGGGDAKIVGSPTKSQTPARGRDKHGDEAAVGASNSGVTETKKMATDTALSPVHTPESPGGGIASADRGAVGRYRTPDSRGGQGHHAHKSQTQTAPPRLDAGGGDGIAGEGACLKRMQSECAVGASHEDKADSPSKSPPAPHHTTTRAEVPLFVNEKTPLNIKVAKRLNLSPTPIVRATSQVDAPDPLTQEPRPLPPPQAPQEVARSMSPDKTSQSPSTSSLKGRKAAGGGGGGLTRALTMYQDSKKKRSAIVKPRTDRPLSSTTSREKLSGSVLGLQEMGAMGGTSSTEASKKELDIGISAALLMAIRTKSRATAAAGAASTSTTTSTTTHNAPSQNSDTDVVARQHFASNNSTMTSASSSERAHGEPRASAEGFQGQKTLPLAASEHTTSTSSIHSEHSEDSRSLSCSGGGGGGASPLTDWDFEGMTAEDWAKWSKEDVIKALLKTREQLRGTDQELEALHNYLKKLLDRIMETNPELLQIS
ncbi:hypothetical protein EMCRGX_G023558 [Ephydatia muelleri]